MRSAAVSGFGARMRPTPGRNPNSPRGPISIDPATRDVVHDEYLREIRKVGNRVVNVELERIGIAVKDPQRK
jgi:branched-chain amino acid transport system substrate-binding protein